jgi:integrase
MACVRKRRGRWGVDYRDGGGVRRWVTCPTRQDAEAVLAQRLMESRQASRSSVEPNITVGEYAERWLTVIGASLKPRTVESYAKNLDFHLLPRFRAVRVRNLQRGTIKSFLADKLQRGLARDTVRVIHATLRAMLNAAIDDGVLIANPAARLGRHLRLSAPPRQRQENIKAMTREQLAAFLEAARRSTPAFYPLFLTLARAGLRVGEALGLQWDDVDHSQGQLRIERAFSGGRLQTPKAGHGRTVDMSQQLSRELRRLLLARKIETLECGWSSMPAWIFCTSAGTPMDESRVRKAFQKALAAAALPLHFSPHGLRHTFASLLLQQGESPAYVQRQLGHASIQLTVDTYGKWLPLGNKAAVDGLDERPSGNKMVTKTESGTADHPEVPDSFGGPSRTRTLDPLIKSQLLYQLS